MDPKPQSRDDYSADVAELVRRACLYVATRLNDLMKQIRIVGGLVPTLLIPPDESNSHSEIHVGTRDLDLGFTVSVLDNSDYREISTRLRSSGFINDKNMDGRQTRQRWIHPVEGIRVDFLIPPNSINSKGGSIQNLERDFAALVTPGLDLAFIDFEKITISGQTILGERASREVYVCGPAAFVILKSLAFRNRGENKDAYDLHFVLQSWPNGLDDIVLRLSAMSENENVQSALNYLKEDFESLDSLGPMRVNRFIEGSDASNEEFCADVSGLVTEFIRKVEASIP